MIDDGVCSALNTDDFLLVAADSGNSGSVNNLFHVDYATGHTVELLVHDDDAHPFAVAYDPTTKLVYWSDLWYRSVSRYSLLWRNHSTIYKDGGGW